MKLKSFLLALVVSLTLTSCLPEYSPDQLIGKWVSGTEYYRFDNDKTGATWDTSDDVQEDEAQAFEWLVSGDQLTIIHIMEMGGRIPKAYTITALTGSILRLRDDYQQSFTYTRVQ